MPSAPRPPASAARVVYAGIVASTLMVSIGALTTTLVLGTATAAVSLPDGLALLCGSIAFLAGIRSGRRGGRPVRGQGADRWWAEHSGRMVMTWGLMELTAVVGAVAAFVTGHLTGFAALAALGLAGLGSFFPSKAESG